LPGERTERRSLAAALAKWMTGHSRQGGTAQLFYKILKGPEAGEPVDLDSEPTGNTVLVRNQIYESPAGVDEHRRCGLERPRKDARAVDLGSVARTSWGDVAARVREGAR
jgi:hypothetical protein